MSEFNDRITRREALARVGYLMGGALSASTVAGVLAGCAAPRGTAAAAWHPRTLTPQQAEMVLAMGEHILPETDTPGARAARVDRYIDAMLTDYYQPAERARFVAGLQRADERARRAFGRGFNDAGPEQQLELMRALAQQAFRDPQAPPLPQADPALQEDRPMLGDERAYPVSDGPWAAEDTGRGAFFRTLKELVLVGYYTSEVGATEELRVNPMGVWLPDVPYTQIGRAWA